MSTADASVPTPPPHPASRPAWLRWLLRRSDANAGGPANADLRLIESAILIVVVLVLAVATANDIGRAVHITERVNLDKHTYRFYMHTRAGVTTPIRKLSVAPGTNSKVDAACSPPLGGVHGSSCLVISGPQGGTGPQHLRTVVGGYSLLPNSRNRFIARYGCFGMPATERLCGAKPPR